MCRTPSTQDKVEQAAASLEAILPPHKCGLIIRHNDHRASHATAAEYYGDLETYPLAAWPSEVGRAEALRTNEVWECVWFPDTATASKQALAPTLRELLRMVSGSK